MPDVIDTLAGIAPGSPLHAIRDQRPQARLHAQASYDSLFSPLSEADASKVERFAIACFVIGLHGRPEMAAFYDAGLAGAGAPAGLKEAIAAAAAAAKGTGPYGHYPKGPLSSEDQTGPVHRLDAASRASLGPRLAAAFEHTHMLVFHPRDSAPAYLQSLIDAGWSTTGIVVISQLVAFLSYQIRVVAGLRALNARPA
ncbi:MAG: CMD domain protein [Reyranella sp.]|uniref:CMD domain protein n=1 Tax=Reyranella sp. TaxID=1929291 RepID=UPI003D12FCE2